MTETGLDDAAWEAPPLQTERKLARPWARYWARALDLTIEVFVVSFPFWFLLGFFAPHLLDPLISGGKVTDLVLQVLLLPPALILDALIVRLFGTTVGKAIAGVQLRSVENQRVGLRVLLRRNLGVYVSGLGLGLPLIVLITLIRSFWIVRDGGIMKYDIKTETRAFGPRGSLLRTTICAILTFVVAGALTALAA